MTEDEQIAVCKVIAQACMWGQGGIASVIVEDLDKKGPHTGREWYDVYRENAKQAQRDSVGTITEEKDLNYWLSQGYWLTNFNEEGCSLFNPPPMNGLMKYVTKELADKKKAEKARVKDMMAKSSAQFFRALAEAQASPSKAPNQQG